MADVIFPWQQNAWQQLQQLRERLPHAILFHGSRGTGKTRFAERFAQALLCEAPTASGDACDQCASCRWFAQYSHPDYRRVRPEILDENNGAEGDEGGETDEAKKGAKATKAPSKEIRIDQIRALADFMNISTHRQGMRVVLLYPAEALNSAASNALLKTLEEPPPGTMFLLVSNQPDRLLPTILSRCRRFTLSMPPTEQALEWLKQQAVSDAEMWLAEQGGAPLAALAMVQADSRQAIDDLLRQLTQPDVQGALATAERLQKTPALELVVWLQRWLHDLLCIKLSGGIRYYPKYRKELGALAARVDVRQLLDEIKAVNERRAVAEHPLSAKLFIEDMLLEYSILFS